jgi:hypothetical protein
LLRSLADLRELNKRTNFKNLLTLEFYEK